MTATVVYSSGLAPISPMMGAAANVTMPFCRKSINVSAPIVVSSAGREGDWLGGFARGWLDAR